VSRGIYEKIQQNQWVFILRHHSDRLTNKKKPEGMNAFRLGHEPGARFRDATVT